MEQDCPFAEMTFTVGFLSMCHHPEMSWPSHVPTAWLVVWGWCTGIPQPCLPSTPRKAGCCLSSLDLSFMLSPLPRSLESGGRTLVGPFFGAGKLVCLSVLLLPAYVFLLMSALELHNSQAPSRCSSGALCPAVGPCRALAPASSRAADAVSF